MPMRFSLVRLIRQNLKVVKRLYPDVDSMQIRALREVTSTLHLSLAMGDVMLIGSKWYVTHSGLLRLARRYQCRGIRVDAVTEFCNPATSHWAFKAVVFRSQKCKGFTGYGDADPSNVSPLVHGAEMRVAETRAVNRALLKAYGIGICSIEEIGSSPAPSETTRASEKLPPKSANGNGYGGPKVRD